MGRWTAKGKERAIPGREALQLLVYIHTPVHIFFMFFHVGKRVGGGTVKGRVCVQGVRAIGVGYTHLGECTASHRQMDGWGTGKG